MKPTQQTHTLPSSTSQSSNQSLAKSVSAPALQKSKSIPSKNFKNATFAKPENVEQTLPTIVLFSYL